MLNYIHYVKIIPSHFSTLGELLDSSIVCCTGAQYFDSSCSATCFLSTIGALKAATTASQVGRGSTAVSNQCFNISRNKSLGSVWFCLKQSSSVCGMSNSSPMSYQLARTEWSALSNALRLGSMCKRNHILYSLLTPHVLYWFRNCIYNVLLCINSIPLQLPPPTTSTQPQTVTSRPWVQLYIPCYHQQ